MDGFDFETDKRYQLFEKALRGEDVTEMMRQFQEEDSDEDEYEERAIRPGRRSAKSSRDVGVWDWMDQEERRAGGKKGGYVTAGIFWNIN